MGHLINSWFDIIGHLGTFFIVLGVIQSSVKKFRIFMTLGSLSFIIYGIFISAWPIVIANTIVGLVSLRYLFKAANNDEQKT